MKRSILPILCSIMIISLITLLDYASDWSQRGFDSTHNYKSTEILSSTLSENWTGAIADQAIISDPSIADGMIFVASKDFNMYALDETSGQVQYSWQSQDEIVASPTTWQGRVYVGSLSGEFSCLSIADGSELWGYQNLGQIYSSPLIVDGVLYLVAGFPVNKLIAFDALTGTEIWRESLPQVSYSTPSYYDGYLYLGCNNGEYYKIDVSDGQTVWTFETDGSILLASPAIDVANNMLYAMPGGGEQVFYAIDLDDTQWANNWTVEISDPNVPAGVFVFKSFMTFSSIMLTGDTAVLTVRFDYNVDSDGNWTVDRYDTNEYLIAIDTSTQALLWQEQTATKIFTDRSSLPRLGLCPTPIAAINNAGTTFIISASSTAASLTSRSLADGSSINNYPLSTATRSTPAIANGKVVVATDDGAVYSFTSDANQAPTAPTSLAPTDNSNVASVSSITWTAGTDSDEGSETLQYLLRIDDDGEVLLDYDTEILTNANTTSYSPQAFSDNSQISYAIRSIDSSGAMSPWSTVAQFWVNMNQDISPMPASNFIALSTDSSVDLSWTASTSSDISLYRLNVSDGQSPDIDIELNNNDTSYTVTSLNNATAYTFTLTAEDYSGLTSLAVTASSTPRFLISINNQTAADLQDTLTTANDGDTVMINRGDFSLNQSTELVSNLSLSGHSPSDSSITVRDNGLVITAPLNKASGDNVEHAGSGNYTEISNLTIIGGTVGIRIEAGATAIIRNVIIRDSSQHGIFIAPDANVTIINCTIIRCGNAGVYNAGSNTTISNCIITDNAYGVTCADTASATISYSNIADNTVADFNSCDTGSSMLSNSPQFVDYDNDDYHVIAGAATVDTGDPDTVYTDEASPRGNRINMGAYGNTIEAETSPTLFIASTTLTNGESNATYSSLITANGGEPPYTWELISGSLPDGLSLDTATGIISGDIALGSSGNYNFAIDITDSLDDSVFDYYNIAVNVAAVTTELHIISNALGNANEYFTYSNNILVAGGFLPYTWTITAGTLPAGLSLDTATGEITGFPDAETLGNYDVTIEVADSDNVAIEQDYNLTVEAALPQSDPDSNNTGGSGSSGCFIATASYGSLLHPWVKHLRNFRDEHLLTNKAGQKFVKLYYHYSPPIADKIATSPIAKFTTRLALVPLIAYAWIMTAWSTTAQFILCFILLILALTITSKRFRKKCQRMITKNSITQM